jgi:hypothetical protein
MLLKKYFAGCLYYFWWFFSRWIGGDLDAGATETIVRNSGERYGPLIWWRREDSKSQGFEVLHSSGEEELVARTGKTAQPHALEAMVSL